MRCSFPGWRVGVAAMAAAAGSAVWAVGAGAAADGPAAKAEAPAAKADAPAAKADAPAAKSDAPALKAEAPKADAADRSSPKDRKDPKPEEPILPDPIPAGEITKLLAGVADSGFAVDDPPTLAALDRVRAEKAESYKVSAKEKAVRWGDLLESPNSSRGRMFVLDGQLLDCVERDFPAKGKVYQAKLSGGSDEIFTVLMPEDPGDRNTRVRMKAYFVRNRQDAQFRPSPLLVARTWQKVVAAPPVEPAPTADPGVKPPPVSPTSKNTSDGKPLLPDGKLVTQFEEELLAVNDRDSSLDPQAARTAFRMCEEMSKDAFAFGPRDRPEAWGNALETPNSYRGALMKMEGVVHSVTEYSNPKDDGRPGAYWVATMGREGSRYAHFVVMLEKPALEPKFRARFKGYFIKMRTYETKNSGEERQGGVFVTKYLEPVGGQEAAPAVEEAPNFLGWINAAIRGPIGWVFVPLLAILLALRYAATRRSPASMGMAGIHLAPAEPLTSKEVIDTLAAMPGGEPDSPRPPELEQNGPPPAH